MRFKDVFSIIGPSMIGPSSSHTAGAVRLGRAARQLFGCLPEAVAITLYGSFAETYQGHGTDVAIIGGLLDMDTDDPRIVRSLQLAHESGMRFEFRTDKGMPPHPNTTVLELAKNERVVMLKGCSIGGGNIEIFGVDGFDVKFSGIYPTLVLYHIDRPGLIADVTNRLSLNAVNIGHMAVDRKAGNGEAMTVIEADQTFTQKALDMLLGLPGITQVKTIQLMERDPTCDSKH